MAVQRKGCHQKYMRFKKPEKDAGQHLFRTLPKLCISRVPSGLLGGIVQLNGMPARTDSFLTGSLTKSPGGPFWHKVCAFDNVQFTHLFSGTYARCRMPFIVSLLKLSAWHTRLAQDSVIKILEQKWCPLQLPEPPRPAPALIFVSRVRMKKYVNNNKCLCPLSKSWTSSSHQTHSIDLNCAEKKSSSAETARVSVGIYNH